MNDYFPLILSWVAGFLLGTIFFGGLWWTVKKGLSSPYSAFWFLGSMLLRMSIALVGFYFVGHEHWGRLLACLFGFFIARFLVTRLTRAPVEHHNPAPKEDHHAP